MVKWYSSGAHSRPIEPAMVVPYDAASISFSAVGAVSCRIVGEERDTKVGTIQMADFINPGGLVKIGENLYEESDGAGTCRVGRAENGFGAIRQGWIEQSNVDLRQEIAEWRRIRASCRLIQRLLKEDAN